MSSRNLLCSVAILPIIALVACGGGSGIVGPTPPQPSFNLSLSPDMVTLAQSGTQNVQVTAIPKNGTINGLPIEVDIANGSIKTLSANLGGLAKFVATPDGTHMFALNESDTRGTLAVWNSSTDSFATQGLSGVIWTDVAVSPNGNRFAAVQGNLSFAGVAIRLFDGTLHFTNATVYPDLAPPDQPFCTGTIFSA